MPTARSLIEPALKFAFEVQGRISGGFSKISGLKEEVEVVNVRDGEDPLQTHKIIGPRKGGEATFEKGIIQDFTALFDWFSEVKNCRAGGNFRGGLDILIKGCDGKVGRKLTLLDAWPKSYTVGELDGTSSGVAVESLVVVFENMEVAAQ